MEKKESSQIFKYLFIVAITLFTILYYFLMQKIVHIFQQNFKILDSQIVLIQNLKSTNSVEAELKEIIQELTNAAKQIPISIENNEEKYETSLSYARKQANKLYKISKKYSLNFTEKDVAEIAHARKSIKEKYDTFVPVVSKKLFANFSKAVQRVRETHRSSQNFKKVFDEARDSYKKIANFIPNYPLTLNAEDQIIMDQDKKYLEAIYLELYKGSADAGPHKNIKTGINQPSQKKAPVNKRTNYKK